MEGLTAPAPVEFDRYGIPRIDAANRDDAFQVLGYVVARDRLFQMDLMRRRARGRLAEVFGRSALSTDRWHRTMGFSDVADAIYARLPEPQRVVLQRYADGVNHAMGDSRIPAFEFGLLAYSPEPWTPMDSIVVSLGLFESLSWSGSQERAATVMEAALPDGVPDYLIWNSHCDGPPSAADDIPACDTKSPELRRLVDILRDTVDEHQAVSANLVRPPPPPGSNAWVISGPRTDGGRALLANDMHLGLTVPNVWYRAELRYQGQMLTGLFLPGVPMMISGSNGHVAWGLTNTAGDFTDLVKLQSAGAGTYTSPHGALQFDERRETIHVRFGSDETLSVRSTIWGPVLPERLLGHEVAVHWTALDADATNFDFIELDEVRSVRDSIEVFKRAGGPPLNALVADDHGNIGWTTTGRIPRRRDGADGRYSRTWSDGGADWDGYVPPDSVPHVVNPASNMLLNANNLMLGPNSRYPIGHQADRGYRARRIEALLLHATKATEGTMLRMQLDTRADVFRFYQRLALAAIGESDQPPLLDEIRRQLRQWDGRTDTNSVGAPLLQAFSWDLADRLLGPLIERCRNLDAQFDEGDWLYHESAMHGLLSIDNLDALARLHGYQDWNSLARDSLMASANSLLDEFGLASLESLTWGTVSRADIRHPFSRVLPAFSRWLDMPRAGQAGCGDCIRKFEDTIGASERLVVSPGHEDQAYLHMPAGQSGHPLSPHYADQHEAWSNGTPLPLLAGPMVHYLDLVPTRSDDDRPN